MERFVELLIKKHSSQITMAEQKELSELLNEHSNAGTVSDSVDEVFNASVKYNLDDDVLGGALKRMQEKRAELAGTTTPGKHGVIHSLWFRWAAAAIFVIVAGMVFFLNNIQTKNGVAGTKTPQSLVATNESSNSHIVLPDGTKVWLNADSKFTYEKDFGESARNVTLEGEAYFDVVKDAKRPFIVHTTTLDVKVLGTAFNVRAYGNEESTEALLVRGSVEVILKKKNNEKITLSPNERIVVQNSYSAAPLIHKDSLRNIPEIELTKVETIASDSLFIRALWNTGRLSFDQDQLKDILPVLEERFNKVFVVKHPPILERRFTGTFRNENIEEVMNTLKLSLGFQYDLHKDTIVIY